jgi:xanthine dehydrogenase accessory factor
MSLAAQARQLGYHVTLAAPAADRRAEPDAHVIVDGFAPRYLNEARRFVVVSTQGKGDEAALRAALAIKAEYHAFVGSRRKMAALREKLVAGGIARRRSIASRRRPGSISARSRRRRSRCRSSPRSPVERRRGQRGGHPFPADRTLIMQDEPTASASRRRRKRSGPRSTIPRS